MEEEEEEGTSNGHGELERKRHKGKHDKPKPWDDDPNIDHWKIEKFDPSWNEGGMLETSEFETLFPQYREKYLQEVWPSIRSALKEHGISCELDLVKGNMKVSTTRKTRDPYIIVKARELLWLLARSVPAPQALKILDDEMQCDIIRIGYLVRNKERFVKRRQRLVGPNSSTLKALEILTGCYILVQGTTVAAMGTSTKKLKQVRRIVEDCIQNKMHPVYHLKILMIKKELENDPNLKNESWDRFLPKFRKKNATKKEKTEEEKAEAKARKQKQEEKNARKKKSYSPFPPPQQPSKEDIQLETGEYFLSDQKKQKKKWQEKLEKQTEKTVEKKRKREAAFVPPEEPAHQDTRKSNDNGNDLASIAVSLKKKSEEFGKKKSSESVNAAEYIAVSGEQPAKNKKKKLKSK